MGEDSIAHSCSVAQPPVNPLEDFPLVRYLHLSAVLLTSCLSISFLWPFVGFMVIDFGLTNDRNQVGYFTGQLLSMFFLGRAVSSAIWGYVADYYGRKTVIYISLVCNGLLMFLFGVIENFRDALIIRFLSGLMNGLLPICKAMASEMCDPRHQARGQSFPNVAWLTGLVIGPAIGGILAQPCEGESVAGSALGLERIEIFCDKPFLLPCLVGALLHLLVLPCAIFLPETGNHGTCSCPSSKRRYAPVNPSVSHVLPESIGAGEQDGGPRNDEPQPQHMVLDETEITTLEDCQRLTEGVGVSSDDASMVASKDRWLTKLSAQLIAMNCSIVVVSNLAENATFVWCMAETSKGGLGWTAGRIGKAYSVCGIISVIFQIGLAPALVRRLGARKALCLGLAVTAPTFMLLPQLGFLSPWMDNPAVTFVTFSLMMSARQLANMICHVALAIITNNSVSAAVRGRLQGAMTSCQSMLQAFVPVISGSLFAWALISLPFGSEFVFLLSGILSVFNALFALSLPDA